MDIFDRYQVKGTIGANGLANPRDFLAPVAAFEDREGDYRLVTKFRLPVTGWRGK